MLLMRSSSNKTVHQERDGDMADFLARKTL
jgi:hypothetical protein